MNGCILWGSRVVIPPLGRPILIRELHDGHPGTTRMKSLARGYMWWPNMDSDIETEVKKCHICQSPRNSPPQAPIHSWQWPLQPWSRIHVDYAGPFMGHYFLVIIDAHIKWVDVHMTTSATSKVTIEKLRNTFATLGLPKVLV